MGTQPFTASFVAGVAFVALATAAGCGHKQPPASASPESPAASASPTPVTPGAPATAGEAAWPPGVLHAYYWECDGGLTLVMKNLVRDDAISLELHEGTRKLPHVPSASGAKYADESIEFWTKGGAATYEHKPAAPINCRELRARSLVEDARARGVVFRGHGNEPGWSVEIGPGDALTYEGSYGQSRHDFSGTQATGDALAGGRVFSADSGDGSIRVTVIHEPCTDDMSSQGFDHSFRVEFGGQTLRGCGDRLGPG